ncbi:Eco57I restriction-modification methylase domain-containing protein [Polyangium spumosum]|uniref:site-specific DNA-methyltransferase (adenine-specific) n=1 Tax=Polyangium spumosum TaxID=889282 RepID=A0A6N7PXJ7_9BACT|nr:N-6 DNA methylase [Polyangium spumosum]MRG96713.1 N-6 DNA methylase [Polyangium spumosum]
MSLSRTRLPLFHAGILKQRLSGHTFPADLDARHEILKKWVLAQRAGKLDSAKEVELHGEFLGDVFGRALGYRTRTGSGAGAWEISAERTMGGGGKSADGALGFFAPGKPAVVLAPIELKGAKRSLDHAMGRVHTPVQQAWDYANHSPGCRFILVSNYKETRLYSTARTPEAYESFLLSEMEDIEAFKRFYLLLGREHLLPAEPGGVSFVDELLAASVKEEADVTNRLYVEYRDLRKKLYRDLCRRHPNLPAADVLQYAQTILDRILFIAFAEDRGLLPKDTIKNTCDYRNKFRPVPVWENFCAVFRWIDKGHEAERFPEYNGGLFAPNTNIDELEVTDEMCAEFKKLAAYDYRDDVSVDVLGHIFEQSITDLEELRGNSGIVLPDQPKLSKRKAEGVFYTPAFITRFIVDQTLGRVFEERWQAALGAHGPGAKKLKEGSPAWKAAWTATYEAYREDIKKIRVLDLSCGSGAFLIAAFDALSREYERVNAELSELNKGQATIFDLTKTVLNNNLFGVDVNAESVEITKLSLWLKTAERGRKLTYLDSNIKWGNSIVRDPMMDPLAFDWTTGEHVRALFDPPTAPEAAEINARWREGFDVVIGNPPYVRQELLTKIKDHLQANYRAYHGMADLFVYFFERGISVLKPGGRLGFIVANKWLRGGYAEALRKLLAAETELETIVDFGHAPIFPDADAFPCVVTLAKPASASPSPSHEVNVTMFPREELAANAIPEYVQQHRYPVPQSRLTAAPWSLEPSALEALMAKIRAAGVPLTEFAGVKPYRGIVTGYNEAFIIDTATRNRLVSEDPRSAEVIKKYLRGQDIDRWASEWGGLWMIFARHGFDISSYPEIEQHLLQFKDSLEPRPRDYRGSNWPGRKPGAYKWFELQDAVDYWQRFEQPKIVYQVIQFHPAYAIDRTGLYLNDKGFFIPSTDSWLLAVLNSPLMWWHNWRYLTHLKDEALTPLGVKMENLPIAAPAQAMRDEAEPAVARLIELTKKNHDAQAAVLDSLRTQFTVAKPGNKLADFASLDSDAFVHEVLRLRPKAAGNLKVAELKALREMYADEALPIQERRREALGLERRLSTLVNEAYGLTSEDVALLWDTAPPRMPFKPA